MFPKIFVEGNISTGIPFIVSTIYSNSLQVISVCVLQLQVDI